VAEVLLNSGRAFYTALGHDTNVLLLDKHADQSFATPSVLGQALLEASRSIDQERTRARRARELQEAYDRLQREHEVAKQKLAEVKANAIRGESVPKERPASAAYARPASYAFWVGLLVVVIFLLGRYSR
jgi:exodeoxyribonuclease VII large subunit